MSSLPTNGNQGHSPTSEGALSIVTGANTGLGLATAHALAARGDRVVFGCRSETAANAAIAEVQRSSGNPDLEWLKLDLGDLILGALKER